VAERADELGGQSRRHFYALPFLDFSPALGHSWSRGQDASGTVLASEHRREPSCADGSAPMLG
jgi:hypothetical protein